MNCPACQTANPDNARFCMNCGARMDSTASAGTEFNLDRYLPRELALKLESARGRASGERRVITMLFCDVKGSTAAAEQLDPEDWTAIINGAFEHMIRPIYKYEGTVARLMGDAILAFFGAPIAHEDDPQRAVLAALEIQDGIRPYIESIRSKYAIDFSLRVGLNTGRVVVGEIGSDLRMEYTAIGDAVNLAARMEQTAAPGTVQISDKTYKLVAPFFEVEPLGKIEIKGKSAPVETYRVLGAKSAPGTLRGLDGLSSPLVGREPELALLDERLQALRNGEGSFVAIIGEAGLGKSTLVADVHKRAQTVPGLVWLEGHALSYARSISYFMWRQIIRESIDAHESDPPDSVREKLGRACAAWKTPLADVPLLEALLAVESPASLTSLAKLQGEDLLQHMTAAVRGYLQAAAGGAPLVLVLDDLHWSDEASLTLLLNLADMADQRPVLFLGLSRPEHEGAGWDAIRRVREKLGARFHEIVLEPLADDKSATLLANLLGADGLPQAMRQSILAKAEGNPLFVEEVIRSLIETEQIVREGEGWRVAAASAGLSLPDTLTGILGARIDRLPEASKQVLQTAAVIGRSFDPQVLAALSEPGLDLAGHFERLQRAGLIEAGGAGAELAFRHALIQDAAYDSILIKRRNELHRRTAETLEAMYSNRTTEFAPLLAHHFSAAQDPRSLNYDVLAGQNASRLYANAEAATHFARALQTAKRVEADPARIGDLYSKYGAALEQSGGYDKAVQNYEELRDFARGRHDPALELSALMALATVYSTFTSLHNPALAEKTLTQALDLAEQTGDQRVQVKLHWNLMLSLLFSKRLDEAARQGELALKLVQDLDDPEQLAFVLNDLARVYSSQGVAEKAFTRIREARELWRRLDNQAMLADSLGAEAETRYAIGDFAEMIDLLKQALAINEKIGNQWGQSYARTLLCIAHFHRGEPDLAIEMGTRGIVLGDEGGLLASSISIRCDLAWMYGCFGSTERGLIMAGQALEIAMAKQPDWQALPTAILVRLYLLAEDPEAAELTVGPDPLEPVSIPYPHYTILLSLANVEMALSKEDYASALAFVEALQAEIPAFYRPGTDEVAFHKAQALFGLGRLAEAREILVKARSSAEALGANQILWSILALLADLEAQAGNSKEAAKLRDQARRIVLAIADRLQASGLREDFLARPQVSALFAVVPKT